MRSGELQAVGLELLQGVHVRSVLDPKNPISNVNWRGTCLGRSAAGGEERLGWFGQGLERRTWSGQRRSLCRRWKSDRSQGPSDRPNVEARCASLVWAGQTAARSHVRNRHGTGCTGGRAEQAGEGRLHGNKAYEENRDGMEEPLHALQWSIDGIRPEMCVRKPTEANYLAGVNACSGVSMSSLRITRLVAFKVASSKPWPWVMASVGQASTQ
jgi:hypothetical protein